MSSDQYRPVPLEFERLPRRLKGAVPYRRGPAAQTVTLVAHDHKIDVLAGKIDAMVSQLTAIDERLPARRGKRG